MQAPHKRMHIIRRFWWWYDAHDALAIFGGTVSLVACTRPFMIKQPGPDEWRKCAGTAWYGACLVSTSCLRCEVKFSRRHRLSKSAEMRRANYCVSNIQKKKKNLHTYGMENRM